MPVQIPRASSLAQLNVGELEGVLDQLFESSAAIAVRLIGMPFNNWDDVMVAASVVIDGLTPDEKRELLRGHARLGEDPQKLRVTNSVSFDEQEGESAAQVAEVRQVLLTLGAQYEDEFGFPFVEFVAGRPLEEIIPVLERRMTNTPEVELEAALHAIVRIAADRVNRSAAPSASDQLKEDAQ
jgi:2-oxo-4-hydroxy-4-carboxy--5-ureidoimidazoline (OHCU) decarboxylase